MDHMDNIAQFDAQKPLIKLVVTSVHDQKVKQFLPPITSRTIDESIRSFGAAASQEGHDFRKFASDFTLWVLGYYYPETGALVPCDRIQISAASEFVK